MKLPLFTFIEDSIHFAYSPALDIYGYGNNEYEATRSFKIILSEYLKYSINKKTIQADLRKCSWNVDKKDKKVSSPDIFTLLSSNKSFRVIVNTKPFKKYDLVVEIPAFF